MSEYFSSSRRNFLKGLGCLTIAFPLFDVNFFPAIAEEGLPQSLKNQPMINNWIEILESGEVKVYTGKMELGQGIRTAIAQVAAEELNVDLEKVTVHLAETDVTPHEGYTAGSGSIEQSAMSVRYAAASARKKLIELAAKKLKWDEKNLTIKNNQISSSDGKVKISFYDVLEGNQIKNAVKLPVPLKDKKLYKYVGKPVPRNDIEKMVRAEENFIHDLRFPDMVHARVVRPPSYEATLKSFDEKLLRQKVSGILKVVKNGTFLAVITSDEYQAVKAQKFLKENSEWSTASELPSHEKLQEHIRNLPVQRENVLQKGNVDHTNKDNLFKASYFRPYQMHGSIGPSCAIGLYKDNKLHLWSHSQGVYPLRESLKKMLNMDDENIHITGVPGSGCYGHNGADDVAADAALIALAFPDKHVRLQWSREDEHLWEPYGSAMVMDLEATLNEKGKISSWKHELWSDSHSTRPGGEAALLLPARHLEKPFKLTSAGYKGGAYRNSQPYYNLANVQVDYNYFNGPLRISALRSLGAYANIFAIESFMEELAHKTGKDPIDFRIEHSDNSRSIEVLQELKKVTRNQKLLKNEGIGYGFSRYKNTAAWCAVAAKVLFDEAAGNYSIKNMWAVIDAGEVINLDGLKNQTEGGMIQAASWTLYEEVKYNRQQVISKNWRAYPIMRFKEVPLVEVKVIPRLYEQPLGAGEAAQGPSAAAVVNAIFAASGKRIRHLPVYKENNG